MHKLLLGIAASTLMVTGALAHSPAPAPVAPAPVYNSAAFDWNGFYMGLGISGAAWSNGLGVGMVEGVVGVNMTVDNVLFGLEGTLGAGSDNTGLSGYQLAVEGRLGYLISPDAVIYGSAGAAYFSLPAAPFATLGAGIEFAVADNVSIDFEYEYWMGTALVAHTFDASMLFSF